MNQHYEIACINGQGDLIMSLLELPCTLAGSKGRKNLIAFFDSGASASCIRRDIAEELANLFYRRPVLCYRLGLQKPAVVREFVDVLAGRHSYQGIGRRVIAVTAHWLLDGRKKSGEG